jgi:hypothetical protein
MGAWEERAEQASARYEDGGARLPEDPDARQRQLTRMGNAAAAAGLSLLMAGRDQEGSAWLAIAAERYRESWPLAAPDSWGRPIGALKARLLAGDSRGALDDAAWALEAGAAGAESPIGRYAAVLAHLARGEDAAAHRLATTLQARSDFPDAVADALVAIAAAERDAYAAAIRAVLADFESRDAFLEDVPVADTVLVLQQLAAARMLEAEFSSPLLPPG